MPCNITVYLRGAKSSVSLAEGGNCPPCPPGSYTHDLAADSQAFHLERTLLHRGQVPSQQFSARELYNYYKFVVSCLTFPCHTCSTTNRV